MNVSQITNAVVAAYPSRRPLMVWGPPGVGKSYAFKEASKVLDVEFQKELPKGRHLPGSAFGFIDLRLSLLEPIDLRGYGFPNQKTKRIETFSPSFLPTSGRGIILLDELVEATFTMQGCASQLLLDRRIGEYVLPDGWVCHSAGNEMSHRASSRGMPTHIANRFIHLNAEVDFDSWIQWALAHEVDIRVIAFIKFRSALLHCFDPQAKGHAYASPRSWEFASDILKTFDANDPGLLLHMMKGAVGEGPGGELCAFLSTFNEMPSVDNILLNPMTAAIPSNPGVLFVLSNTLAVRASKDNLTTIVKYFDRLSDSGHPEYAISAMKAISSKDNSALTKTRAFCEWAARHNHLLS